MTSSSTPQVEALVAQPTRIADVAEPSSVARGSLGSRRGETQLSDQTNLLPLRKIVPIFLALSVCVLVSTLDSTIVATALPTISSAFHAGSVISWVPAAYLLTYTAFQPLYGRFSDIFGRKAAMLFAIVIFIVGNLATGFSRTVVELIVFRGISGVGGGGIESMAQIIVSDIVSLKDRGKYQGIVASILAVGYAVGPLIGGGISQSISWRWCFWVILPLCVASIFVIIFLLPLKPVEGDIERKLLLVDYLGAALTLAGSGLIILPLIWGGVTFPWLSPVVLAPLFCGLFVLVVFCFWEWRGARLPIVPMYIFKHSTVTGVFITAFINGVITFSALFYLPQFFQVAIGYSPVRAGVYLLPVMVTMVVASSSAGQIISRTGRYRPLIFGGFAILSLGCGLISTLKPTTSEAATVIFMLLAGLGAGGTLQTTTIAAQATVGRKDMGIVTAVRNFMRTMGGTVSLALGSTILNTSLREAMTGLGLSEAVIKEVIDNPTLLGTRLEASSAATLGALGISAEVAGGPILNGYVKGFRDVFLLNSSLAAMAFVISVLLIRHKTLVRPDEARLRQEALAALDAKRKWTKPPVDNTPTLMPTEDIEMTATTAARGDSKTVNAVESRI